VEGFLPAWPLSLSQVIGSGGRNTICNMGQPELFYSDKDVGIKKLITRRPLFLPNPHLLVPDFFFSISISFPKASSERSAQQKN
jgi:hypothetical protein